jgi:hypothetical protein
MQIWVKAGENHTKCLKFKMPKVPKIKMKSINVPNFRHFSSF